MSRHLLPSHRIRVNVPPIKCQGIKTKLAPFIASNISWEGEGRWVEPFLGSGVVLFSIQPDRAFVGDINPHIVQFYKDLQIGKIRPAEVREHLVIEGGLLLQKGQDHYYFIRERFNANPNSLDFLFLSRACFNGLMRFNGKGNFNVPFCRKPARFSQAYTTKIVNQVRAISQVMRDKDWTFVNTDWHSLLGAAKPDDFVYLDPPYIGRHTDYFDSWSEVDALELAKTTQALDCGYAMSMWLENKYRRNSHIDEEWKGTTIRTMEHFYHVGSTENLRNSMIEALLIRKEFAAKERSELASERICSRVGEFAFDSTGEA